MLKITYLESGLILERLSVSVETWIARHSCLTIRLGGTLHVQSSHACLLLSRHLPDLDLFLIDLQQADIEVDRCDRTHLEITLPGIWITADPVSDSGIFLASLSASWEIQLLHFWQLSHTEVPAKGAQIGI